METNPKADRTSRKKTKMKNKNLKKTKVVLKDRRLHL